MSKLIDIIHPFEIKKINNINEYLFILKNVLRISAQKRVISRPEGINVPIRWSIALSKIVVDFGTSKQRDITGIHLDNLGFYFNESSVTFNSIKFVLKNIKNCSHFDTLIEKYNLKKNENRFFNLIVNEENCFIMGLFMRCQNLKRGGIYSSKGKKSITLDSSEDFLSEVESKVDFFKSPQRLKMKSDYKKIYLKFLNKIEKEVVLVTFKNNIHYELYINNYIHGTIEKDKLKVSDYFKFIKKELDFKENTMFWFLIYHLTLMFNNILLEDLNTKNINSIIIHDNISGEFIKIVKEFKFNNDLKEKSLLSPIMPVSF